MSEHDDANDDKDEHGAGEAGLEGDFVEIDWEPLQAAIDAMADEGLDVDDTEVMRDHLAALLASLLRRIKAEDEELSDDDLAEMAAEVAAFAVQIALGEEDVPVLAATEIDEDES